MSLSLKVEVSDWTPSPVMERNTSSIFGLRRPNPAVSRLRSDRHFHVMELQLQLRGLMEVRDAAHDFYAKIRAVLPQTALDTIIDRLTYNTMLDLGITGSEWIYCLKNPLVQKLLDELGVEDDVRYDIIECLDAEGSGVVTTTELHEGLLMCRDPPRAHELLECRLKVREMQQWLHNTLKPEVGAIRRSLEIAESTGSFGLPPSDGSQAMALTPSLRSSLVSHQSQQSQSSRKPVLNRNGSAEWRLHQGYSLPDDPTPRHDSSSRVRQNSKTSSRRTSTETSSTQRSPLQTFV